MGCSKCKKNNTEREYFESQYDSMTKKVVWVLVIWSIFAVYGIYTLISKFL